MVMDRRSMMSGQTFKDRVIGLIDEIKEVKGELNGQIKKALEDLDPFQLERSKEDLEDAGVTRDDIMLLCDARIKAFTSTVAIEEEIMELPGHPIHTLMEEHRQILLFMSGVRERAGELRSGRAAELEDVEPFITEAQKHFQREENVLFPYMERHGIEGPPAAMWSEHEVLRASERELISLIGRRRFMGPEEFAEELECRSTTLLSLLNAHFHKENQVLFPMALRALDFQEWNEARRQFEEIGPCNFVEPHAPLEFRTVEVGPSQEGEFTLPTGKFTVGELEMVLNALPIDFTFVDRDDRVRYYSGSPDRIFVRTPAVVGRKVQNCHPQKSVHIVQGILDGFKAGSRDRAEFWLELQGRFIHIRYFPLRDKMGRYQGVLEVAQDVTGIRKLEGQKRLLDEG